MPGNMDSKDSDALEIAQERFILEWGRMSSSWGINRTMAQIHALLLVSGEAYTMDEIIDKLHISRGNASMNLRDLCEWAVIRRFRRPGDRKDMYQANGDILSMFARVVRERKRREIDPTVAAIRECLDLVPQSDKTENAETLRHRLTVLLELFSLIDRVYQQVFETDASFREVFEVLGKTEEITIPSNPPSAE
ncbi:MAG: transcriptional regulator [Armatimonadetes bacterium]|nr:transcriptional regulator [Armatimonadota bacterium]